MLECRKPLIYVMRALESPAGASTRPGRIVRVSSKSKIQMDVTMGQNRENVLSIRITCIVLATSLLLTVIGYVWFASLANSMIERQEHYEKAALILRVMRDCYDDAQ